MRVTWIVKRRLTGVFRRELHFVIGCVALFGRFNIHSFAIVVVSFMYVEGSGFLGIDCINKWTGVIQHSSKRRQVIQHSPKSRQVIQYSSKSSTVSFLHALYAAVRPGQPPSISPTHLQHASHREPRHVHPATSTSHTSSRVTVKME
jgi:hypothetical protein